MAYFKRAEFWHRTGAVLRRKRACSRDSESRRRTKTQLLFFILNREDFSFVIHLDRQPRTSRRREAQTGSRARSGSRSERTLDAVEHSRTLMEWWPFLIFHRGGLRIKVINNTSSDERHRISRTFSQSSVSRSDSSPSSSGSSPSSSPVPASSCLGAQLR